MRTVAGLPIRTLIAAAAAMFLTACAATSPQSGDAVELAPPAAAPASETFRPAPPATPGPAPAAADAAVYPRYGDSDDYVCNNGAPADPRTVAACARLRGTAASGPSGTGRFGDADDNLCNHGAPSDPRTIAACERLRGPTR